MNLDLTGKNALVCGSTQGIGLAAAVELAGMGASVTLCARNWNKITNLLPTLPRPGAASGQVHGGLIADFEHPIEAAAALQAKLADPQLFAKDAAKFAATAAELEKTQAELAKAEEDWLALELLREEIEG